MGPPASSPPTAGHPRPGPGLSALPCLLIVLVRVLAARVSLRRVVQGGQAALLKGEAPETLSIRGRAPGKGARRQAHSVVTVGGAPLGPPTPPVHPRWLRQAQPWSHGVWLPALAALRRQAAPGIGKPEPGPGLVVALAGVRGPWGLRAGVTTPQTRALGAVGQGWAGGVSAPTLPPTRF